MIVPLFSGFKFKGAKHRSINKMTLEEKVAQMIMVRVRGEFYNSESGYYKELKRIVSSYNIGGLITFGGSVHGTFYNLKELQDASKVPLLIGADYERGLGGWMNGATLFPTNMAIAATGNEDYAYKQGQITAKEAKAIGVHIVFAPVLDINNNPENPIINFRSYSDDKEIVTKFGSAFINGIQDGGLYACAKHYPGHGNTSVDSHTSLPSISGDFNYLADNELYPFKHAADIGVKMIMVGHIAMPGIDSSGVPATYSPVLTENIIRKKWGYNGLLITDALEMGALSEIAWAGESAIRAVEAGTDILLLPSDIENTIKSVVDAVNSGRLSESRIDESVERIINAKNELGLYDSKSKATWENVSKQIGSTNHIRTANEIAHRSITLVKDSGTIPLRAERIDSLTHIVMSTDDDVRSMLKRFIRDIRATHTHLNEIFINDELTNLGIQDALERAEGSDHIIISLLVRIRMDKGISTIDDSHATLIHELHKLGAPVTVISFGSPYLPSYDYIDTYLCAYGYGSVSQVAAADAIWGRSRISGKLPIKLSEGIQKKHGIDRARTKTGFVLNDMSIDMTSAWDIIDTAISDKIFPGAQVFISKDKKIIASQGFGKETYSDVSDNITEMSIYDVASITKILSVIPITMKLIKQKKLGLNQSIGQFFPEHSSNEVKDITISQLLSHSSGLKPFVEYFKDSSIVSKKQILNDVLSHDLDFKPGTAYQYSDLGMIVMMGIIETVTGRDLDGLSARYFFRPLGMQSTAYNPSNSLIDNIVPTEYDYQLRGRLVHGEVHDENAWVMGGVSGHAGIFSTSKDIAIMMQMLNNGGIWLGRRYFNSASIDQFTERQDQYFETDRALGFDKPSTSGKSSAGDYLSDNSFGHLGFTGTSVWSDPDSDIIIVLLTNRVHPSRDRGGIYKVRRDFHNEVSNLLIGE